MRDRHSLFHRSGCHHGGRDADLQELAGQVTFLENYVIDFPNNSIILSHDGHGNPALASKPEDVTIKSTIYYQGVNGFGAGLEFVYAPGLVTMMSLVSIKNRWRLVYAEGESIPIKARPVAAPQMLFKPKTLGIQGWCNAWCLAGASHHQALAMGSLGGKIKTVADMLNLDVIEV